jgi:hypothetical protein
VLITDRLEITDKSRTKDGYLVTAARFARTGIYEYAGRDLGKPEKDIVRVYRPEDEVFSQDAMASFAHRPITNDHPEGMVDAANWKREAVGFTDGRVARDGDFVVIPMMVTDKAAIEDVDAGKQELSAGYSCDIDFSSGQTDSGEQYDAVMRNIRGNHIAIVDRGRAGSECRIGDSFDQETHEMSELRKILLDSIGISIMANDQAVDALTKLDGDLKTAKAQIDTLTTDHDKAIAAKDAEIAKKDQDISDLQSKQLKPEQIDTLVADRTALLASAAKLVDKFDGKGKSSEQIKREVVAAKCGDASVADKSAAYVEARFDALVDGIPAEDKGNDQFRDALTHSTGPVPTLDGKTLSVADAQRAEREAFNQSVDLNAWRTPKA